nr:hypothetical protein [Tanacetum cinerariifolium]
MCMSYTDVAQVANAARNYEILHERDDDDAERPDKRQKSGDRHQPTTQQSSHRNHSHNNDRHGSDRRGGGDNHRSNNNYAGNNNRNSGNGRDQRNRGHQSNRSANSGSQQSRGSSEGYSYPVCTSCNAPLRKEDVRIGDKGKGIMVEEPVKLKKKDQIRLDEAAALRLQAELQIEFDEKQRLARERAEKELEANIALIKTWDDV